MINNSRLLVVIIAVLVTGGYLLFNAQPHRTHAVQQAQSNAPTSATSSSANEVEVTSLAASPCQSDCASSLPDVNKYFLHKNSFTHEEVSNYLRDTGHMPPERVTLGVKDAGDEIYLTAMLRGYGMSRYTQNYRGEYNLKFLTEMAESGDFAAQRQLVFITDPLAVEGIEQTLTSNAAYLTEEAKVYNREELAINADVVALSPEQRHEAYQHALLVAAAYGKTDLLSRAKRLEGVNNNEASLVGMYAAILDGDSYQAFTASAIFANTSAEDMARIKAEAETIHAEITRLRAKLQISTDSIATKDNAIAIASERECPVQPALKLADSDCVVIWD